MTKLTGRWRMSLFRKVVIVMVLIVSLPTLALGFLSINRSSAQVYSITRNLMQDSLEHNIQRFNLRLAEVESLSEAALNSAELKLLLRDATPASTMDEYDFIRAINTMVDELGIGYETKIYPIDYKAFPNYARGIREDTGWFAQAALMEGQGEWHLEETAGGTSGSLLYARAIRDYPTLRTLGVMAIRVPADDFQSLLVYPNKLFNTTFLLLDRDDRTIFRKTGAHKPVDAILDNESFHDDNSFNKFAYRTETYFKAVQSLDRYGWKLVAYIPVEDLLGNIQQIGLLMWSIVVLGILVMIVFLLIAVRYITNPIKLMVRHMQHVQLEEIREKFNFRNDEIGRLFRGYNKMIANTRELMQRQKETEEEKRKLEIRSLIHQINPHFLYNTLDAIKWKAEKTNESDIIDMVGSLTNLLRYSINNNEEFTTVEREIEHVRNYLKIEQIRNSNNFAVYFQVQPHILNCPFLKLCFQPIVENSIKHAMKKREEGGKIFISVYQADEDLICCVEDNGPGGSAAETAAFRQSAEPAKDRTATGIGLQNTHRRLQLQFGGEYGLKMESRSEGGVRVTLAHPKLPNGQGDRQAADLTVEEDAV